MKKRLKSGQTHPRKSMSATSLDVSVNLFDKTCVLGTAKGIPLVARTFKEKKTTYRISTTDRCSMMASENTRLRTFAQPLVPMLRLSTIL